MKVVKIKMLVHFTDENYSIALYTNKEYLAVDAGENYWLAQQRPGSEFNWAVAKASEAVIVPETKKG